MKASWPREQHNSELRSSDGRIYRSKEKTSNHQIHFRDDQRAISHFRSDNVKGDNERNMLVSLHVESESVRSTAQLFIQISTNYFLKRIIQWHPSSGLREVVTPRRRRLILRMKLRTGEPEKPQPLLLEADIFKQMLAIAMILMGKRGWLDLLKISGLRRCQVRLIR
ncbi:hypothetical protein GQ457_08G016990 [Hibiscus cannabinus]